MLRILRLLPAAILVSWTIAAPGRSQTASPDLSRVDVLRYRIRIEIFDTVSSVRAQTEITAVIGPDSPGEIALDFVGLIIDSLSVNGNASPYRRDSARIFVARPVPTRGRDTITITVTYHGRPSSGLIIGKTKFGDASVFADNWPDRARGWFPSIDHPYDKAAADVIVIAPRRIDVVGNGILKQVAAIPGDRKLWHWSESNPIPTYCIVFGAAEFSATYHGSAGGTPIFHYVYGKESDPTAESFGRTADIVKTFSDLIGPYPYEKLALVESSTHFGGMENATAIFLDEHLVGSRRNLESLSAHEIAHQWFGDCVTEGDWSHLWLSEGFAVYFEKLFTEIAEGREQFRSAMRVVRQTYIRYDTAGTATLVPSTPVHPSSLLTPVSYEKGACILHMLRREMGDSLFFRGIRRYFSKFRNSTAVTADFQRCMEQESAKPLEWFFHQWVNSPGYPVLDVRWKWDEQTRSVRVRITQKQAGEPFRFTVDLESESPSGKARETILVQNRDESFRFPQKSRPDRLVLDPGEWILHVSSLRQD